VIGGVILDQSAGGGIGAAKRGASSLRSVRRDLGLSARQHDLPALATFPNDGILTRNVNMVDPNTKRQIHFLETSSAGLRGQSGGPIFDVNGHVWALQSRTTHLPLGFAPKVKANGKEITEHQFMHVGWGVHVPHIRELLENFKVPFQSA
jgi:hypothetical protein